MCTYMYLLEPFSYLKGSRHVLDLPYALLHRFSSIVDIQAGIALNKSFVKLISWSLRR